jgi:hypothetical protein
MSLASPPYAALTSGINCEAGAKSASSRDRVAGNSLGFP